MLSVKAGSKRFTGRVKMELFFSKNKKKIYVLFQISFYALVALMSEYFSLMPFIFRSVISYKHIEHSIVDEVFY